MKQLPDKSVEIATNTAEVNVQHEIIAKIHTKLNTSLSLSTTPEIISVDANVDANSAYRKKDELNSENIDQLNVKNVDFLCKESLDEISLGSPAGRRISFSHMNFSHFNFFYICIFLAAWLLIRVSPICKM